MRGEGERLPAHVAVCGEHSPHTVFADRVVEHLDAVEVALATDDPWDGFVSYVRTAAALQARDRGIPDLVTMELSSAPEIDQLRTRAFDGLVRRVERAQAAGVLRADFTHPDVVLLLMANAAMRANGERRLGTGP